MKTLYKIIIFLGVFQVMILSVNALDVFPQNSRLYSDIDMSALQKDAETSAWDVFVYLFTPTSNTYFGGVFNNMSIAALSGVFIVTGVASAILTHSLVIPSVIVLFYSVFNMLTKSMLFIDTLFRQWGSQALIFLGISIGVALFIVFLITIVESPTQGRS